MTQSSLLTRDLIQNLCTKLDHDDKAALIVKKLVNENWLQKVDDLRYVPRKRLEHWEVPLKLVDEVYDYLAETEASAITAGISAWYNYTLRPALSQYMTGPVSHTLDKLRDDAEKRNDPDTWAAKRMQRWFRNRKVRREREKEQRLMENAMLDENHGEDFRRLSDKECEKRRQARAMARIAIAVRAWAKRHREKKKQRMDQKGSAKGQADKGPDTAKDAKRQSLSGTNHGLAELLVKHSSGTVKDCDVCRLVRATFRAAGHADEDCEKHLERLVTLNWIEQVEDLDLIEDYHYEGWGIPEKVVVLLKQELREYHASNGINYSEFANSAVTGATNLYTYVYGAVFGDADEESDGEDEAKRESVASVEERYSGRTQRF